MQIDILGTNYNYTETDEKQDSGLMSRDGYCDAYAKIITVRRQDNYNIGLPESIKNIKKYSDNVKRHEIVHAYLHESGLTAWAEDERLVEWIAWHLPKLNETIVKIDFYSDIIREKEKAESEENI